MPTLPRLPTELLIRIFSLLQVADLLSVQHTCRRFHAIISIDTSLQYVLHTELNLLEDLLPPDVSLRDRLALLKQHESAWNNLQFNTFTQFAADDVHQAQHFILQEGYLIYKKISPNTVRYGYKDLYSSSTLPKAEARWSHFIFVTPIPPTDIVFAVDQNLIVAISQEGGGFEFYFIEFTTGALHPLSLVHNVFLPSSPPFWFNRKPDVQAFRDYILVTDSADASVSTFLAISWKTGTTTHLRKLPGPLRVAVVDPDNCLIALIQGTMNGIEICELRLTSSDPSLHTLCSLRLPIFKYTHPISIKTDMEWIPTLKPQDQTEPQRSRNRKFPFRPYRAGTIALFLTFRTHSEGTNQYAIFVSVGALIAAAHSGVRHVPWAGWGPAGTRAVHLGKGPLPRPRPAGQFWITNYAPLVVRDYDSLRAGYVTKKKKKTSTRSVASGGPSPGPRSTTLFGEQWEKRMIKTFLPYRKFIADGPIFKRVVQVVADREWVVVVSRTVRQTVADVVLLEAHAAVVCQCAAYTDSASTNQGMWRRRHQVYLRNWEK